MGRGRPGYTWRPGPGSLLDTDDELLVLGGIRSWHRAAGPCKSRVLSVGSPVPGETGTRQKAQCGGLRKQTSEGGVRGGDHG